MYEGLMYNVRRIYLKYQVTKYQVTNLPHVKILTDSTSFLRDVQTIKFGVSLFHRFTHQCVLIV